MNDIQAQLNAFDERVTNIENHLETLADNVLSLRETLQLVADALVLDDQEQNDVDNEQK